MKKKSCLGSIIFKALQYIASSLCHNFFCLGEAVQGSLKFYFVKISTQAYINIHYSIYY